MLLRTAASLMMLTTALAETASAQTIEYDAGEYQYAETLPPSQQDDVVTQTLPAEPVRPAERVIETRRAPVEAPVFVTRPMVQATAAPAPVEPVYTQQVVAAPPVVYAAPTATAAPTSVYPAQSVYASPAAPVAYTYPTGGAARVIYPAGAPQASPLPTVYSYQPGAVYQLAAPLPPGARIVAFNRESWLADCRSRLAGYDEADRTRIIAGMIGTTADYIGPGNQCEAYLDSYMARAASVSSAGQGQPYMLVPVSPAVPQQPVYREYVAPVD